MPFPGWFDAWGALTGKSFRDAADVAQTLQDTLEAGASVNFFVFHGGTSFGFCGAGGNLSTVGLFEPQVTSYDYGGLLDEAGEVTEKYLRCREVLASFLKKPELLEKSFPKARRLPESPPLELESTVSLQEAFGALTEGRCVSSAVPVPAEQVGLGYGYILYRTRVPSTNKLPLTFGREAIRDFASIMSEGRVLGTIYRNDSRPGCREFELPEEGCEIEVLVDMMGRVNFGPGLATERKGLVGPGSVQLGSPFTGPMRAVLGWSIFPLPMDEDSLSKLPWSDSSGRLSWERGPRFFRYGLHVQQPADGFLALDGFRKGFACVNGFNLGRYWEAFVTSTGLFATGGPSKIIVHLGTSTPTWS